MDNKYRILQHHKNVAFYILAALIFIMFGAHYSLYNSFNKLNDSLTKVISSLEKPEGLRNKYSSAEEYNKKLEEQLHNSFKHQKESVVREKNNHYYSFRVLFCICIFQIIILVWPLKKLD